MFLRCFEPTLKVQSADNNSVTFCSNTAIFYVLVTNETTLLQLPANNYISKIVDDSSFNNDTLEIDIADYITVWTVSNNWIATSSTSPIIYNIDNDIASFESGASVIKISEEDLTNSSYSFNVIVYSDNTYLTIRVDLTIV